MAELYAAMSQVGVEVTPEQLGYTLLHLSMSKERELLESMNAMAKKQECFERVFEPVSSDQGGFIARIDDGGVAVFDPRHSNSLHVFKNVEDFLNKYLTPA